jgi:hypothetical protein
MIDARKVIADFEAVVNMTARQLESRLESEGSRRVGSKSEGAGDSVGHHSGRRVVAILGKRQADDTDDDLRHMAKMVDYVHQHISQKPEGDSERTPWRYSFLNRGRDPAKRPKVPRKTKSSA